MLNHYNTEIVKIKNIKLEAENIKLFTLGFENKEFIESFNPLPGQIVEVGVPCFGEGPFAVCSCGFEKRFFQICVRNVGQLTEKMHKLKKGDIMTLRGPYGLGVFPKTTRNLLLIAGGLGLVPLRPLIQRKIKYFKNGQSQKIQLFYGARSQKDIIFKDEYEEWRKYIDIYLTLDKEEQGWNGHIGLVPTLFQDVKLAENPIAILCGPPVMYKFVLNELKNLGFKDEDIYVSLERRIHCAVGVCQHCAIGSKYVCKDGPVFRYDKIKDIMGAV